MTPRRTLALLLSAALLVGACAGDDDGGDRGAPSTPEVLASIADGVIIPSYEALASNVDALAAALTDLCRAPSPAALASAQRRWRDTELAWESTRASGVGPAIEHRAMQAIAFRARADKVEATVADPTSADPDRLDDLGSDVRGLFAVEVLLFAPGGASLTTSGGAARCAYAKAAIELVARSALAVLDTWADLDGGYRGTFVAGMDGDPVSSVAALVNETAFRLQQIDDQGLRALAEASAYDELPSTRREGPAAYGVASTRGVLGGVAAVVLGPDEQPGLADLVRGRSPGTGDRLEALTTAAVEALRALPESGAAASADRAALRRAADAVAALHVLVATEVASRLGVTIGFSDSDGDS